MLDELHVKNIALIEEASIAFSPQLTVLSGETGAGKTALLSALQLICGKRADSKAVADGAGEAVAEARFVQGEGEHVVRRRLSAAGRSRCQVDGQLATVGELAEASAFIRVHSQHEQVLLLQPATQLAYLDAFVSPQGEHLAAYRVARQRYVKALQTFQQLDEADARATQQLEFMRFTAAQIGKVDPKPGEYERLEAELPRLQHGEQLAAAVGEALQALHADGAALDALARACAALQREAGIDDELDALSARLAGLLAELEDATRDVNAYAQGVTHDPQRLEQVLARLDELSGLMRRFGPGMPQVLSAWQEAKAAIAAHEASPERLAAAKRELQEAEAAYREQARLLAQQREQAAKGFCEGLAACVHELAMQGAAFEFAFEDLPLARWTDAGSQHAELLYRPAAASAARPLSRIASGGELSRILLALECLRREQGAGEECTIVFDEVDQGVGGATGMAVAERLAQLAQHAQVIVVTHLPQVAARAQRHYVVEKTQTAAGAASTSVLEVQGERRVAEIARMLAGTADTAALEHARTLLAGVQESA